MELLVKKIVSSMVQVILFTVIPFVWWLCTARKKQKFAEWLGIKKMAGGRKTFVSIIITSVAFLLCGAFTLLTLQGVETATSDFTGLGAVAIPAVLVYAVFNTALSEEILFRGFLLKRMQNKFGFTVANSIQAILFGLLHGVMFISIVDMVKAVLIIVFTTAIAWGMGYINEKKAEGSIFPSWTIHAISNIFSGLCAAFHIF
ncbi:MAG: CPBP family intramembrane metalloprotease [Eubacteriales bacterium]|nr:CPBP family intramembrane metalloprotease [Eubacteriales bacterium]